MDCYYARLHKKKKPKNPKVKHVQILLVIIPDQKMGSGSCLTNKV